MNKLIDEVFIITLSKYTVENNKKDNYSPSFSIDAVYSDYSKAIKYLNEVEKIYKTEKYKVYRKNEKTLIVDIPIKNNINGYISNEYKITNEVIVDILYIKR